MRGNGSPLTHIFYGSAPLVSGTPSTAVVTAISPASRRSQVSCAGSPRYHRGERGQGGQHVDQFDYGRGAQRGSGHDLLHVCRDIGALCVFVLCSPASCLFPLRAFASYTTTLEFADYFPGIHHIGAALGAVVLAGDPGPQTYFYWLVANYPLGPLAPVLVGSLSDAPSVLSSANYNQIVPTYPTGVTSLDLLRTTWEQLIHGRVRVRRVDHSHIGEYQRSIEFSERLHGTTTLNVNAYAAASHWFNLNTEKHNQDA